MGAFSIMGNRAIGKAQSKYNQMQSQISRHYHTQAHPYTYTPTMRTHSHNEDLNPTTAKLKFNIGRQ